MVHKIKIEKEYYKNVEQGLKTFEVRKNDRNFKVNENSIETVRNIIVEITYIFDDENFVKKGL